MNSMLFVNQSASCLLMSRGKARQLGVAEDRMVYLHGCGDANDPRPVSERPELHRCVPAQVAGEQAFRMAGKTAADMELLDLYACFPCAPAIAARELGLPGANTEAGGRLDGEKLSLIGGLMYNGGPGGNTAMHRWAAEQLVGSRGRGLARKAPSQPQPQPQPQPQAQLQNHNLNCNHSHSYNRIHSALCTVLNSNPSVRAASPPWWSACASPPTRASSASCTRTEAS